MNIADYKASGILEAYVMQLVSDQERREVKSLMGIYPELANEVDELGRTLENYALMYSVEPPETLKNSIMPTLTFRPPESARPVVATRTARPVYQGAWIIAGLIGVVLFMFSYFLYSQLQTTESTVLALQKTNGSLENEVRQLRTYQSNTSAFISLMHKVGTRTFELEGNPKFPNSHLMIAWNANTQEVIVQAQQLPDLPSEQQYQLWAIRNGQHTSVGLFNSQPEGYVQVLFKTPIKQADNFVLTVEPAGGSSAPSLTESLVVGSTDGPIS